MTATFFVGDAIEVMSKLPEKSVDLILTSPPFLALRSYLPADHPDKALEGGSQATPGEYVDWLLDVVEACARVLAPHGSLCFELGDTYSGTGGAGGDWSDSPLTTKARVKGGSDAGPPRRGYGPAGGYDRKFGGTLENRTSGGGGRGWPLAKSLSLIPESFRFAMVYGVNPHTGRRTAPWRLRNVIRWVRPNPPVGALGDKFRPATSELMVFCKAKDRFFDLDAVRTEHSRTNFGNLTPNKVTGSRNDDGQSYYTDSNPAGAPPLDWWSISLPGGEEGTTPKVPCEHGQMNPHPSEICPGGWSPTAESWGVESNSPPPLDWWNIPPTGYAGAHYAVWPPELLIKPIKAMCPDRVCRTCGEASRRIVGEVQYVKAGKAMTGDPATYFNLRAGLDNPGVKPGSTAAKRAGPGSSDASITRQAETLGFSDCGHDDWRPGLVLDPFAGSGTTLAVATGHGRDAIGIDLDERNYDLALERVGPFILSRAT